MKDMDFIPLVALGALLFIACIGGLVVGIIEQILK